MFSCSDRDSDVGALGPELLAEREFPFPREIS